MRQLRILLLLTFPVFFFSTTNIFAFGPGETFPGYVVTNSGKTLEGKVILGTFIERELKFKFIEKGKKIVYTPSDIQAYGFEKIEIDGLGKEHKVWVHYERIEALEPPRIFGPTTVFVEKEVKGEIDLFCFYIQQRSNIKKPYEFYYLLRDSNDKLIKVTEANFEKVIKKEFGDYVALVNRLGQKQFAYNNIGRMTKDYNYWKGQNLAPEFYVVSPENYDGFSGQR